MLEDALSRAGALRCAQGRLSAHGLHTLPMEKWMLTSDSRTFFVWRGSLSGLKGSRTKGNCTLLEGKCSVTE